MRKIFWRLAVIVFVAVPMMTSCSKDIDADASAKEQSNVVTITIASPTEEPETRVVINGSLKITGWELNDVVNLYIVQYPPESGEEYGGISDPVAFKCIDASAGIFSGDIGENNIEDYNFAAFGATVSIIEYNSEGHLVLTPNTRSSANLKDVVMMAADKIEGSYTMQVVNNVIKVTNNRSEDLEVAWKGKTYLGSDIGFFDPFVALCYDSDPSCRFFEGIILGNIPSVHKGVWANASHYILEKNNVTYINMGIGGHPNESYGLAKSDGIFVVPLTQLGLNKSAASGKIFKVTVN